ncbi:hypothetical protein LCGC14_2110390 [marine sediment metagenome]|uniref:PIN domain-containing protein n=1 Tax=marine sediment metagenome TaxID=412755 RepID=A0A0F9E799_9ZZZZ
MIIIDTSAWLLALRKEFHPVIKERIEKILLESEVAVTGIIILELLGGTKIENEYYRLKSRLDSLYYIEADKSLWNNSSRLAFDLRRKGITIPFTDIFIAASTINTNAKLIHADSHFELISQHTELNVESYLPLIQ